jgi:ABC-type glutathione transport system ATPase component
MHPRPLEAGHPGVMTPRKPADTPLLEAVGLHQEFRLRASPGRPSSVTALHDVSLQVYKGERLGIVGETGSGKTTLGRALAGLRRPDKGSVHFDGIDLYALKPPALRQLRARLQMVLQDSSSALDPRMSVHDLIAEGLIVHTRLPAQQVSDRVRSILADTRIPAEMLPRRPGSLSGGQRQRVAVARSIILSPELVILDEPVSALDISVQAQLLNMLLDLQEAKQLTYIFIVHDLAVARWFCNRIIVMHHGAIVEEAPSQQLFQAPRHPYTAQLLAAIPGSGHATNSLPQPEH